jgi:hypothetical protein
MTELWTKTPEDRSEFCHAGSISYGLGARPPRNLASIAAGDVKATAASRNALGSLSYDFTPLRVCVTSVSALVLADGEMALWGASVGKISYGFCLLAMPIDDIPRWAPTRADPRSQAAPTLAGWTDAVDAASLGMIS